MHVHVVVPQVTALLSAPPSRSCRLAPLIQCDYCPLLFHMDCLDPPLTALPAGKWMCPNHVEHLVVRSPGRHVFPGALAVRLTASLFCPAEPEEPQPDGPLPALRPVPGQDVPARRQAGLPAESPP